jgi:hypothetical protein
MADRAQEGFYLRGKLSSNFRSEMVRKRSKKSSTDKKKGNKPSESLEMFDTLFKDDLEMESRQAQRDKDAWAEEEFSESTEMFDKVFREDLEGEKEEGKKRSPAKKKRGKSKPSELPPWKRRAEEEEKTAEKGEKSRPKRTSAGRGRGALLLLFLVLLAGAGLHYYGLVDFGPYAAHLKGLKTEAVLLYEAYAGKGKAAAEKDENSAIKKPVPARPAPQTAVAAVGDKAPFKPQAPELKPKPAPRKVPVPAEKKSPQPTPSAVSAMTAGSPAKGPKKKPVSFPYSVYLGSYSQTESLQRAMREYEEKGLFPFWVKVDLGKKGVWHRVFAGYFQTEAEADAFIKEKGIPEAEARLVKYGNLIGTYPSERALQGQRGTLIKLGYSPYVIPGGKDEYRLYVGAFSRKSHAEALLRDLSTIGIRSQIVPR